MRIHARVAVGESRAVGSATLRPRVTCGARLGIRRVSTPARVVDGELGSQVFNL